MKIRLVRAGGGCWLAAEWDVGINARTELFNLIFKIFYLNEKSDKDYGFIDRIK